jgi:hypothetical protein
LRDGGIIKVAKFLKEEIATPHERLAMTVYLYLFPLGLIISIRSELGQNPRGDHLSPQSPQII